MFEFVSKRKYWYLISLLIIVPGILSLAFRGLNWGIDFTAGTITEVRFEQAVTVQDVRDVLAAQGLQQSVVQPSGDNQVIIRTPEMTEAENRAMVAGVEGALGTLTVLRSDSVSGVISKELLWKAGLALALAALAIVVYISWRFEFKQGLAAVIALLHDSLITVGLFSLLWLQVDSAFVAAVLTIIGYSINATIVIFDRIRENLKTAKKTEPLDSVIDRSLTQTLARSVNTALTVLFMLGALYFLGGVTLKTFALALIIGVTSGTYSSIFIAGPVWRDLKKGLPKTKRPAGAPA